MDRRRALGSLAAAVAAVGNTRHAAGATPGTTGSVAPAAPKDMPYRTLGKTGVRVSAIGLGGYHIGMQKDRAESIRIIRTAVDRGINFLDNCWDYNNGESETRMGDALRDGYRARVFLMSKFDGRTKASTARQIDESLKRLQTDVIDLMQYHENIRMEDPDRFFAEGGPREALDEAKKAGKIRYVGFTGHKDPAVHLRILEMAQERQYTFDACQLPINVMDAHFRSFEHHVVPKLVAQGVAVLGMKPMGSGEILKTQAVTPVECLHYALSRPTSVVITGCESVERLEQALDAARTYRPLTDAAVAALLEKTKKPAMTGRYEPFKTNTMFDGTAEHPEWMS
jgi:aryl-alcohol dehydrogenase-like predicted oxidoreductase